MDQRPFFFKRFALFHHRSTMKIGTDAILLGRWVEVNGDDEVLDIGTGCGLLPLMLAQKGIKSADAVEIDQDSFEEAAQNFSNSAWKSRLFAINDDIKRYAESCSKKYDLVVSNPPFFFGDNIPEKEKKGLARHTNTLSYNDLLVSVKKLLKPDGRFALVLPARESLTFLKDAENQGFFLKKEMKIVPIEGKEPNRINMQLVVNQVDSVESETFILRHPDHSFTKEYKEFLKDYYLD
ncbi:MAG: methyltransferase [Bacteroidales bacterium]|nr:methyltransferase [Bacteroidales bacterium]